MTTRCFLLPFSAVALLAGLKAQTPPATPASTPTPAPAAPASPPAASPGAGSAAQPPAATTTPPATPASGISKEQALKEIDAGLARFEVAVNAEASPVLQSAMKTRLTVLRQRREDMAKNYTPGRFRALQASLLQEVRVEDRMTPSVDPNEGRLRRPVSLDAAVNAAARDADRVMEATRREEQYRADRAAEQASQRRMDVARINADLSRLSAQIDASTVGDPNRRAELNMRLRDLEQERTRLELSPQPSTFDTLRADIQREADRAR